MAGKQKKPKHPIEVVRALAVEPSLVLAKTRALDPLCRHCGTPRAAYAFARRVLTALDEGAFAETIVQRFDQAFDVYGVRADDVLWYIKLTIDLDQSGEDFLLVLSFHPAEGPIKTNGGTLTP